MAALNDPSIVRLSDHEVYTISSFIRSLDQNAQIYLFGSRTDPAKKGGDIDLLIISSSLKPRDKRKIWIELTARLGEQKIDIIIATDYGSPFVRIAQSTGVRL